MFKLSTLRIWLWSLFALLACQTGARAAGEDKCSYRGALVDACCPARATKTVVNNGPDKCGPAPELCGNAECYVCPADYIIYGGPTTNHVCQKVASKTQKGSTYVYAKAKCAKAGNDAVFNDNGWYANSWSTTLISPAVPGLKCYASKSTGLASCEACGAPALITH